MPTTINGSNVTIPGTAIIATLLLPIVQTAVNYAALATDEVILITATGKTVTLPTAVGVSRKRYLIKLTAVGSATVATTSGENIDGATTYSLTAQHRYVEVVSDGTQWRITGAGPSSGGAQYTFTEADDGAIGGITPTVGLAFYVDNAGTISTWFNGAWH